MSFLARFIEYERWVVTRFPFKTVPCRTRAGLIATMQCSCTVNSILEACPCRIAIGLSPSVGLDSSRVPRSGGCNLGLVPGGGKGVSSTPTLSPVSPLSKLTPVRKLHRAGVRPVPGIPPGVQDRVGGKGLKNWTGQE